ncbi:MAG TPA: hypothetical protein VEB63_06030 [Chitinophagaceae bacterium]|nr:hypothetical protein [Chitinophagaceae bacterium]
MKTLKISLAFLFLGIANLALAQSKEESFKVAGNCGMCKTKIEKAAKSAGASYALWNKDTKVLTVRYDNSSTNAAKIQEKIAEVGYDNAGARATNAAYDKLHGCCKYDRDALATAAAADCCVEGKCDIPACQEAGCCKDGKCDMSLCKEKGAASSDSCCGKDGKKNGKKASCCKKSE